jgi:hypothetical protein
MFPNACAHDDGLCRRGVPIVVCSDGEYTCPGDMSAAENGVGDQRQKRKKPRFLHHCWNLPREVESILPLTSR